MLMFSKESFTLTTIAKFLQPYLVALTPLLLLATVNMGQIEISELYLPMVLLFALVFVVELIYWITFRDLEKASILTSITMLIFMIHGHVYSLVRKNVSESLYQLLLPYDLIHIVLFFVWIIVLVTCFYLILKKEIQFKKLDHFLSIFPPFLVAMCVLQLCTGYQLGKGLVATSILSREMARESVFKQSADTPKLTSHVVLNSQLPDIYYVILDGYSRQDQIKEICDYDNSEFILSLEKRGFYVASQSHSNYCQTHLSLPSSLNLRYLTTEINSSGPTSSDHSWCYEMLKTNDLAKYLKEQGYRYAHLNTNWGGTAHTKLADYSYPATLSEFQELIIDSTILSPIPMKIDKGTIIELQLEKLGQIPEMEEPTFTLAHLICPHPPYYFNQDGRIPAHQLEIEWVGCEKLYVDQMIYLNQQIISILDEILLKSDQPPIILIQADHGSAFLQGKGGPESLDKEHLDQFIEERMSILNAYYVPEDCKKQLYPSITPVNSFRVILNSLFDQDFPLLPDKMYYSWYKHPFDVKDVTQQLQPTGRDTSHEKSVSNAHKD